MFERSRLIRIGAVIALGILTAIVVYATASQESTSPKYEFVCIDQVEYFYSQVAQGPVAPHLKPDGSLHLCE